MFKGSTKEKESSRRLLLGGGSFLCLFKCVLSPAPFAGVLLYYPCPLPLLSFNSVSVWSFSGAFQLGGISFKICPAVFSRSALRKSFFSNRPQVSARGAWKILHGFQCPQLLPQVSPSPKIPAADFFSFIKMTLLFGAARERVPQIVKALKPGGCLCS